MCGIIGQLAFGKLTEEEEKVRQESMIFLGSELLQLSQEKGKDATGVSLLFDDGNYVGLKMGIPSIEFISRYGKTSKEYGGFIKVWRESDLPVRTFLGHCRSTTRGSSLDNVNNHPVKVGDIIGVHNGTLTNDDKIFSNLKCKRDGIVDSEAIFRLLHHFSKNGTEPFTTKMLEEVVRRLTGTFAVLAFSGNNPYQVCAFRDGRPFEMALVKPLKLVICASDKKFMEAALFRYNKHINLYINGTNFPTLTKGDIEYKYLLDDSALVFDLRTEIKKDTDIEDLYDYEKMTRLKLACYDKAVVSTPVVNRNTATGNSNFKNNNVPTRTVPSGGASIRNQARNQAGFNLKSADATAGRVWNKKNNKYEMVGTDEEVAESAKRSAVEIDIETGKTVCLDLSTGGEETADIDGKFALEDRGKEMETSMIPSNPAKIEEVEVEARSVPEIEEEHPANTVEVDVTVDAEAIEKAEELVKDEPKYESDDEVLEALEIVDKETLKSLPLSALANRMKSYIIKQGIIKGYTARKSEEPRGHNVHKTSNAEAHIRVAKAMVKTLIRAMEKSHKKLSDDLVEKAVIETLESGSELTKSMLDKVFKPGDERDNEIIAKIKRIVGDKENR